MRRVFFLEPWSIAVSWCVTAIFIVHFHEDDKKKKALNWLRKMYLLYISPETENVTHLLAHDQKKSSVIFVGAEKWPDNLKSFLCCILWQCVMAGATLDVLISDGDLGLFMPSTFALASDSDGSAESNSTLLLAGEQNCGEGGEAEECVWWSAFNSMKRDILRKVDGHVCVRACVHTPGCYLCCTERQHGSRGHHYCGISYKININLSFSHF